jgi:hypothetical protein
VNSRNPPKLFLFKLANASIPNSERITIYSGDFYRIPQIVDYRVATYKNVVSLALSGYDLNRSTINIEYVRDAREGNIVKKIEPCPVGPRTYLFDGKLAGAGTSKIVVTEFEPIRLADGTMALSVPLAQTSSSNSVIAPSEPVTKSPLSPSP